MKPMGRITAGLGLLLSVFLTSACATTDERSQTERTRQDADRSMQQLHEEEGNHGY